MNAGEFLKTQREQFRARRSLSPLSATERATRRAAFGVTETTSIANETVLEEAGIKSVENGLSIPYGATSIGMAVLRGTAMLVPGAEVSVSRFRPSPRGRSLARVFVPNEETDPFSRYEDARHILEDVVDGVQPVGWLTRDRKTVKAAARKVRYVRVWDDRRIEEQRNGGQIR